ncbi:MAG: YbjQ family protein [Actinobacteria bacterium]|nr:YbjQ family protein [Actinomycetota bacterium]
MTNTAEAPVIEFQVTSAFDLPGMRVEKSLGVTFGLVVRSMGFTKAVTGGISSLRQGEVSQFTVVLEDTRRHALDRMIENAKLLGANAVIAVRFDSSEIGKARAEVVAYGTAVVAVPAP